MLSKTFFSIWNCRYFYYTDNKNFKSKTRPRCTVDTVFSQHQRCSFPIIFKFLSKIRLLLLFRNNNIQKLVDKQTCETTGSRLLTCFTCLYCLTNIIQNIIVKIWIKYRLFSKFNISFISNCDNSNLLWG